MPNEVHSYHCRCRDCDALWRDPARFKPEERAPHGTVFVIVTAIGLALCAILALFF